MKSAIVIGGSIAGMLAARVLADQFQLVTIVDRDHFPQQPGPRRGAPQASHQHVLLLRGQMILERLFPGLTNELLAAGAPMMDMGKDVEWLTPAGPALRFESGLTMLTCTRDLLEWSIRRRIAQDTRVSVIPGAEVFGLLTSHDASQITGVRMRWRDTHSSEEPGPMAADLVVDAGGRTSRLPEWLKDLGYPMAEETVVNGFLGYASRLYQLDKTERMAWQGAYIQPAPPEITRGGVLFPTEGNRWLLTLAGLGKDYPPVDEAGFLEFARSLRSPLFYDAIRKARPLSAITGFRATENRLRRYERMARWPEGLVVLGDAACTFNPVYAQGMTVAALAAETLQSSLEQYIHNGRIDGLSGFGKEFQRRLARVNDPPWLLATSEDMRVRGTVGGVLDFKTRLMHGYMDDVIGLTTYRADVRKVFLSAMHMLNQPTALFRPQILMRVMVRKLGIRKRTSVRAVRQSGHKDRSTRPSRQSA